jgi:hypothetical protein
LHSRNKYSCTALTFSYFPQTSRGRSLFFFYTEYDNLKHKLNKYRVRKEALEQPEVTKLVEIDKRAGPHSAYVTNDRSLAPKLPVPAVFHDAYLPELAQNTGNSVLVWDSSLQSKTMKTPEQV